MTAMYHPLVAMRQETYNDYRHIINSQRKSAVEVLQETKSLYVKSAAALKSQSPEEGHRDDFTHSPRFPHQRRQQRSCDLEAKLRRLIDSKENLVEDVWEKSDVQYKSLPNLSASSRESLSSTLHNAPSTDAQDPSRSPSSMSESDSSSGKSYGKPPSITKSSGSLGGSVGKVEARLSWREPVAKIELIRSKSDPGEVRIFQEELPAKLEEFFQYLGLTSEGYRWLTRAESAASSPVYFPSVGGSRGSSPPCGGGLEPPGEANQISASISIVERNARIIKWLVACSKS